MSTYTIFIQLVQPIKFKNLKIQKLRKSKIKSIQKFINQIQTSYSKITISTYN